MNARRSSHRGQRAEPLPDHVSPREARLQRRPARDGAAGHRAGRAARRPTSSCSTSSSRMDGYAVARELRKHPGLPRAPDHRRDIVRHGRRPGEGARGRLQRLHREADQPRDVRARRSKPSCPRPAREARHDPRPDRRRQRGEPLLPARCCSGPRLRGRPAAQRRRGAGLARGTRRT